MSQQKRTRLIPYLSLLLNALRTAYPNAMRPAEAVALIRTKADISPEDLIRTTKNGGQSIFENDVHWARYYLFKAGLIDKAPRGQWVLTPAGNDAHLNTDESQILYSHIRDLNLKSSVQEDEDAIAPDAENFDDESGPAYWFVGTLWSSGDQLPRFLNEGVWESHSDDELSIINRIKLGDRIAVKAALVRKHGLPFDVGGKPVAVMRIKATGIVTEASNGSRAIAVKWDPPFAPRDWYFSTYRKTIASVDIESEVGKRLIDFAFTGVSQDYGWWLAQPYWLEKYGAPKSTGPGSSQDGSVGDEEDVLDEAEGPTYKIDDIVAEGCFLAIDELSDILSRWRAKKNMILQGPPGTGKTWLAKRLGFAIIGSNDRDTSKSRLRVVQFHPSLAYEDFVRGWRPAGKGQLELVDGVLMQSIAAAASEPDRPFVLVIEEINRGNPAQIFGEMLTLLENTKRRASEAIELAYGKPGERVFIPENLYVIGTMNLADRSLAIVDLALRRRFAFIDLEPQLRPAWRKWCTNHGLDLEIVLKIENRIVSLNNDIAAAISLGPQYRIGHSYVTPDADEKVIDGLAWFRAKVDSEIGPLLDEYWYDAPDLARTARAGLLAQLSQP